MKFYDDENERHPWARSVGVYLDRDAASRAVKWLAKVYRLGRVVVEWERDGSLVSWAHQKQGKLPYLIRFASSASWLVLAHEVAHLWQFETEGYSRHDADLAGKVTRVIELLEVWDYVRASAERQAELYALRDLAQRFPLLRYSCPVGLRKTLQPLKLPRSPSPRRKQSAPRSRSSSTSGTRLKAAS